MRSTNILLHVLVCDVAWLEPIFFQVSGSKKELISRLLAALGVQGSTTSQADVAAASSSSAYREGEEIGTTVSAPAAAVATATAAPSPRRKPKFISLNAADVANRKKSQERVPYSDEEDEEHQVWGGVNIVVVVAVVHTCTHNALRYA